MAAIRDLKKDINYVTGELVAECLTYEFLFPEKQRQEFTNVIVDAFKFRAEAFDKIHVARRTKGKERVQEFKKLRSELNQQLIDFSVRLGNAVNEK